MLRIAVEFFLCLEMSRCHRTIPSLSKEQLMCFKQLPSDYRIRYYVF